MLHRCFSRRRPPVTKTFVQHLQKNYVSRRSIFEQREMLLFLAKRLQEFYHRCRSTGFHLIYTVIWTALSLNLCNTKKAWQSPAWWSPSAVLQTLTFCGYVGKFGYHGNKGGLVQESGTFLLYKPSYSQFYVQTANFSLPWQRGSVVGQFEWHHETGWPRKHRRVMANFVYKYPNLCYRHILLTVVLPYCNSRPLTRLVYIASEHQRYTPLL